MIYNLARPDFGFKDSADEILHTLFTCSINNEAVLKALFKVKYDKLTFSRSVEIAVETENAAKIAKETVCGSKPTRSFHKVSAKKFSEKKASSSYESDRSKVKCFRCGNPNHLAFECRFKDAICNFRKIASHLKKVCSKKALQEQQFTTNVVIVVDVQ